MIEEPFAQGCTVLHNIDPRVKIFYDVLFSILIAITHKLCLASISLGLAVFLVLLAQLKVKILVQRILVANIFILFLWLIIPFSMSGNILFTIFGLPASYQGIMYTLLITVKCNAIILLNIALISTSSIFDLVHALRHFHIPDKLIHIFFFLFRYANTMAVEYETIQKTLKTRGFQPNTSMHTYRTYGSVIGTLLVRGHDRSEQIHKAMVCRGFKGKYWLLDHFHFMPKDAGAAFVFALILILLGVLQWTRVLS
jgi:cobalt/nickel transport system permease protein